MAVLFDQTRCLSAFLKKGNNMESAKDSQLLGYYQSKQNQASSHQKRSYCSNI